MAKIKTRQVVVLLKSIITNHQVEAVRVRSADQMEVLKFDPHIQQTVLYREVKKICGLSDQKKRRARRS